MNYKRTVKIILYRLQQKTNSSTIGDLANKMGVKRNTMLSWIARNNMNFHLLFDFCEQNDIYISEVLDMKAPLDYETSQRVENIRKNMEEIKSYIHEESKIRTGLKPKDEIKLTIIKPDKE